jgi:hypothetical protein
MDAFVAGLSSFIRIGIHLQNTSIISGGTVKVTAVDSPRSCVDAYRFGTLIGINLGLSRYNEPGKEF